MDLIKVKRLTKEYSRQGAFFQKGRVIKAVDDVSFTIKRKSIFGLVGESGCGKTSLARAILYLNIPIKGEVFFDDISLKVLNHYELKRLRKRMQIVFQHPQNVMNPQMNLKTILAEPFVNRGFKTRERKEKIFEYIQKVGLDMLHLEKYPHELSGGQKQRAVIARALAMAPEFLVLDEPVSNLDVSVEAQIINLLLDLKEKLSLTYLFISHDLNLISYISDIIAVMYFGRFVELAKTEDLIKNPLHPYTLRLFSLRPGFNAAIEEIDTTHFNKPYQNGCPFFERCSVSVTKCRKEIPPLLKVEENHHVACHVIEK